MTEAGTPRETNSPSAIALLLAPVVLFVMMLQRFADLLADLRQTRHRTKQNWQESHQDLRQCEWVIACALAQGAARLLADKPLDVRSLDANLDVPAGFRPGLPRSSWEMHRRFIDVARFHADPERYIRRHAARIRAAAGRDAAPVDVELIIPITPPLIARAAQSLAPDRAHVRGPP